MNIDTEKTCIKPEVFYSSQGKVDFNVVWCENFVLAWNELKNYIGNDIEFDDGTPELAQKLNQRNFSKNIISHNDYYIKVSKLNDGTITDLKNDIYKDLE